MGALSIGAILLKHHRLDWERFGAIALSTADYLQLLFLASGLLEDTLVAVGLTIGGADRLVDQRADALATRSICREGILAAIKDLRERERGGGEDLLPEPTDAGRENWRNMRVRAAEEQHRQLFVRVMTDSDY